VVTPWGRPGAAADLGRSRAVPPARPGGRKIPANRAAIRAGAGDRTVIPPRIGETSHGAASAARGRGPAAAGPPYPAPGAERP